MPETKNGLPCINTECGSSDAMSIYEGGDAYCFSCASYFHADQVTGIVDSDTGGGIITKTFEKRTHTPTTKVTTKAENVPERGLNEASLLYYGVGCIHSESTGEITGLEFPIYTNGNQTAVKSYTFEGKNFSVDGEGKKSELFGQNKVSEGGKLLVITEGEIDCMSAHQLLKQQGKNYNVVSLPFGANTRAIKNNLEFIESFESVILNFDMDKVGQKTAEEVADLLTPGKVKLMSLETKDCNEYLTTKGDSSGYLKALYTARAYRPDGVVQLQDSWDCMWDSSQESSVPFPWGGLNDLLYGMRGREILTFTAGSGSGKSAVVRELSHHLLKATDDNIGLLLLEESVARTAWGIVGIEASLPLSIREERVGIPKENIKKWWDATAGSGRLFTLDHFGSTSEENLLSRVRYMIKGLGCRWIVLDHLSIVVSSMESGDERKTIDSIMTKLRQMTEETGAGLLLVSHIRRMQGDKGAEDGKEISLSHLRGSQSIAQLSDGVIALERNQQSDNKLEANLTKLRVLKNRYAGLTGIATSLAYTPETGRLVEVKDVEEYLASDEKEF